VSARVNRILAFGVTARVELDGLNGSTGQVFEVEITRDEVARLGVEEGQVVRLVPSRLSVFGRDPAGAAPVPAPNWEI
jgi:sulfate transport system ATP-binding protein